MAAPLFVKTASSFCRPCQPPGALTLASEIEYDGPGVDINLC